MAILVTLAIAVAAALVAIGVHHIVQRRFGYDVLSLHNDVAGFIYSAIGVIFAVVLGFVVIVVWQKYDDVRTYVDDEVAAALDIYHVADGFPPQLRDRIRAQLLDYSKIVVNREWRTMARGGLAVGGSEDVESIAHEIQTFHPSNSSEQDAHQLAIREMKELFDARRQRIRAREPSVPPLLWFALFSGAAATLGFTFLFGVKNRLAQLLMTGILAALITIMFVVIQGLDNPFQGASAIEPTGWQYFAERAHSIDTP
jgi:Protein of unknown function (DUF4239)